MASEHNCRVLLVDDEVEFVQTLVKRLARRQFEVTPAHSGAEALDVLAANPVDVVVLDMKMPGMDGIETLRRIKIEYPLIEVILLTGHASIDAAVEGMERGAFDYLMKPMEFDELLFKIEDAFKKKSIQEAKIKDLEG